MKFNTRLKELRLTNGLTQKELAKVIGVGRTTISEYESGKIVPKQDGLLKIANHFNVSVDYLTGVSNEPTTQKDNASALDDVLNHIHHFILTKDDLSYNGEILTLKQKIIIDKLIIQLKDNIDLMLKCEI